MFKVIEEGSWTQTFSGNKGENSFHLPTYPPCSRGTAPLWLSASLTHSSSCQAGSSPQQLGWGSCPSGSWSRSQSCSPPEPHPLGLYVPTNCKTEKKSEYDAENQRKNITVLKATHHWMHVCTILKALTSSHIWEASWPSHPSPDLLRCWLFPLASPSPRAHQPAYTPPLLPSQSPPLPRAARGWRPGTGPQHLL